MTPVIKDEIIESSTNDSKAAFIITEGSTDWKHMKAAYNALSTQGEHRDFFSQLQFDFFEYEPCKTEMGDKALISFCEGIAKIQNKRNIIFIADRDDNNTNKKLMNSSGDFKSWGNNVFSFILPLPRHRESTPSICIEHLYTDEIIQTELLCADDKNRRLYIGSEFDDTGVHHTEDLKCINLNKCGDSKIDIIEGTEKERIIPLRGNKQGAENYALPKSKFAEAILNQDKAFNDIDFSPFLNIFKTIDEIIKYKPTN